ncbi:MAG: hydantoinase/oxoprolinase family protein [Pseudorhodoplanes sp.]|uniref:hydantoinase/oxoprolinase family protein n=1 Tax=Pseudorhodoplanes sp. TaxID=1934341 RepID=UPI003D0D1A86
MPTQAPTTPHYRLGVDIGGTFADFALMNDATGEISVYKAPSRHENISAGVLEGLAAVAERQKISPSDIRYFVNGTTIAVNTVIQRNGAKTALLVTEGFRDLLIIGRLRLTDVLNLHTERTAPLVPRRFVLEIPERVLPSGQVHKALDRNSLVAAAKHLRAAGIESIAVCFMHAYVNNQHELEAREILQEHCPDAYICISSEIWPQLREYERGLITTMNAYVGPRMNAYFSALDGGASTIKLGANPHVTRSNGGIMALPSARRLPVGTLMSGPAAGVVGALHLAKQCGIESILTFDMGGTSVDVAIVPGEVQYSSESVVGDFPVIMPAVSVSSIGAGGGSIAYLDSAGVLKVGPESAGATPGPAAYGRGGMRPTITDAYLTMGILAPDRFLGGEIKLDPELAQTALLTVGKPLGLDERETAEGIVRVATSVMYAKLLALMAQEGVDPNDFALFAYGGAGPSHAFILAAELGFRQVIVPRFPGVTCALGALVADVKNDFVRTVYQEVGKDVDSALFEAWSELDRQGREWLDQEDIPVGHTAVLRSADMRYKGQSFEIHVQAEGAAQNDLAALMALFHDRHQQIYGHSEPGAPVEIVNIRSTIVGFNPKSSSTISASPAGSGMTPKAPERRRVFFNGQTLNAAIYPRAMLAPGDVLTEPSIIEQYDTTTFVPPGFRVMVDASGMLIGERL